MCQWCGKNKEQQIARIWLFNDTPIDKLEWYQISHNIHERKLIDIYLVLLIFQCQFFRNVTSVVSRSLDYKILGSSKEKVSWKEKAWRSMEMSLSFSLDLLYYNVLSINWIDKINHWRNCCVMYAGKKIKFRYFSYLWYD